MIIFMMHNIIALFSEYYKTHGAIVYTSFGVVVGLTYYYYRKAKDNHENQHAKYKVILDETRVLVAKGIDEKYYSFDEFYEGV